LRLFSLGRLHHLSFSSHGFATALPAPSPSRSRTGSWICF
jgi:hypothetical protein